MLRSVCSVYLVFIPFALTQIGAVGDIQDFDLGAEEPPAPHPFVDNAAQCNDTATLFTRMKTWRKINEQITTWQRALTALKRYSFEIHSFYSSLYQSLIPANPYPHPRSQHRPGSGGLGVSTERKLTAEDLTLEIPSMAAMLCDPHDTDCFDALDVNRVDEAGGAHGLATGNSNERAIKGVLQTHASESTRLKSYGYMVMAASVVLACGVVLL